MEVILISNIGIIISAVLAASAGGAVGYILRKKIVDAEIGERDSIKNEIKELEKLILSCNKYEWNIQTS